MNTKLFLLLGTSLPLIPTLTFAQCVATQDCETLGYTETSCNGGKGVKCPFGNKWACFKSDSECEQQFCDKYGFKYTCTGSGYSGGSGTACGGKYTACTCTTGYEWKDGGCQQQVLNGPDGNVYKCNGSIVGVKTSEMNFYIAMNDLGQMNWNNANSACQNYSFCSNLKGSFPTLNQFETIHQNNSSINNLLLSNGGSQLTNDWYWVSTYDAAHFAYYISNPLSGSGGIGNDKDFYHVRPILTSW